MEDLNKKLDKISEKLEVIVETQVEMGKVQVAQAADLKHHIYRSDLNEKHIRIIEAKVEPLTEFHSKFNGIMKFVGMIATSVAMVAGVVKIIEFFK